MGIKNYKTNLIQAFPKIVSRKKPDDIYTLCIDVNSLLHKVCHIAKNKTKFKVILINMLKELIKVIKPKCIGIFTDGQAILAKANTQIKRRNKYLYSKSSGISPLNLTPGTPFMDFVDDTIKEYLKTLSISTHYSSSKENNEGEIKLFSWLIKNNIRNRTCVVGNDADLVVLAMASRPLLDIYIYNEKTYISLYKLINSLSHLVPSKFNYSWHPVRMDFVLLSLFQGNDYNHSISQFKKLLTAYIKLQKNKEGFLIKKNGQLNLRSIKKLLSKIHTSNSIECDANNVIKYLTCIQWNINLYTDQTVSNFIPDHNLVNIKSIIQHIPKYIPKLNISLEWLNPDVYTLLLMPSTGKDLLPDKLKKLMDDNSPIKDLFPGPCPICIEWKDKLRNIKKPPDDASDDIITKYKELLSQTSQGYAKHIKISHFVKELPIKRIEDAVKEL